MNKTRVLFPVLIVFLVISLVGCGGSRKSQVLFEDHFDYATASPWTPVNGWSKQMILLFDDFRVTAL